MANNNHWDEKDQKQYEHIRESELKEGREEKTSDRIAAATVNKERRRQGRTLAQQQGSAEGGSK
ncbi:hypothetical protein CRD60_04260 [Bifidobacterium aemilianum]|uniref:RelE/ParE family protein n=2 Tax=Bifidobacterium aemilianum TaxID=2493120 RepID=A0A366K8A4_9BIFI|nr:hypothetical protein CRD60_04260 [Bifidobacterium aemilianum]